jgi:hypothetical protein
MSAPPPESLQEISVSLPRELVDYLFQESSRANIQPADLLQQAILNYRFLLERSKAGANVLIEERGRPMKKVDLPMS